ncbi:MAG: diguanylate cyclase [Betaproteobacteria bacterium]
MQLDSSTLIFSIGILSLLMAFISWTFPGPISERDYGLKTWSIGITFVGISLILIFLRGLLHPFWGVFMANICLMTGGTLGLLAPARFYQVKVRYSVVILALAGGILSLLLHTVWRYSIAFAMVGVCVAMSVVMLYTVRVVYTNSPRPVPFAAHVFAGSMGLMGGAYLMRATAVLINPNVPVGPVSLSGGHQSMLIVGALFVVCSTMSLYAVVHDEQKNEIAERACRDPLTGLFNRRAFFELADKLEAQGAAFAILMIDIDHFKSIKDSHGHLGGDRVLVHAARLIQSVFRTDDIACRFGGEEFCVLLRECNRAQALQLAEELVSRWAAEPLDVSDGPRITVTTSVGVCARAPEQTLLKTLQNADAALYSAKHQGRNRAVAYSEDPTTVT